MQTAWCRVLLFAGWTDWFEVVDVVTTNWITFTMADGSKWIVGNRQSTEVQIVYTEPDQHTPKPPRGRS